MIRVFEAQNCSARTPHHRVLYHNRNLEVKEKTKQLLRWKRKDTGVFLLWFFLNVGHKEREAMCVSMHILKCRNLYMYVLKC